MSATLAAPAVIENIGSIEPSPRSLEFDAQLWLDSTHIITAKLHYHNSTFIDFDAVNYFLIVAHVHASSCSCRPPSQGESDDATAPLQNVLLKDFDLCGDVVVMFRIAYRDIVLEQSPHCTFSGTCTKYKQQPSRWYFPSCGLTMDDLQQTVSHPFNFVRQRLRPFDRATSPSCERARREAKNICSLAPLRLRSAILCTFNPSLETPPSRVLSFAASMPCIRSTRSQQRSHPRQRSEYE
ncbi:hypothetical protein BC826DRAFT_1104136 [Russula brevipes]|nr:hypothetical protein BC826DRAFT_1104136 [Russula brevipes]